MKPPVDAPDVDAVEAGRIDTERVEPVRELLAAARDVRRRAARPRALRLRRPGGPACRSRAPGPPARAPEPAPATLRAPVRRGGRRVASSRLSLPLRRGARRRRAPAVDDVAEALTARGLPDQPEELALRVGIAREHPVQKRQELVRLPAARADGGGAPTRGTSLRPDAMLGRNRPQRTGSPRPRRAESP